MAASDGNSGRTIYRLGAPRKISGECNTFDKIWVIKVNGTEHQITIKKKISQKLVVKHNRRTLMDKVYLFAKPSQGYCFVSWVEGGMTFEVFYNTVLRCLRTNADHYELRVNGVNFCDLPDDSVGRYGRRRRRVVENTGKRGVGTSRDDSDANIFSRNNNNNNNNMRRGPNGATLQMTRSLGFLYASERIGVHGSGRSVGDAEGSSGTENECAG